MTRAQKNERINKLRKWFNSEKPHCEKCGRVLVDVRTLDGQSIGKGCPRC